jgi:transcriptional regulator with XRE-family HTH domain
MFVLGNTMIISATAYDIFLQVTFMNDGIGGRIKKHRRRLGYTQEKLAKLIYVSRSAVGNYEIGKRIPSDTVIYLLSKCLGVSSEYLLTGKMSPFGEYMERLVLMDYKIDVSGLLTEHRILMLRFYDSLVQKELEVKSQKKESS